MPAVNPSAIKQVEPVHFSRYEDVARALRHPELVPHGSVNLTVPPQPAAPTSPGIAPHAAMRAAVQQALAPAQLTQWRDTFAAQAQALVSALPNGMPVDLVKVLAEPFSLESALVVTGAPRTLATQCAAHARQIYLAAAVARDGTPPAKSLAEAAALAKLLSSAASPTAAIADVQTFVALSQTLPALLAGAWRVLIADTEALTLMLSQPQRVTACVGELLRLGSPARAVFRQAAVDLDIGPHHLQRGDAVALLLGSANRDPARFPNPERLDLARDTSGQLGLGAGLHLCAGASLVRMAFVVCTQALLEGCKSLTLVDPAESAIVWCGGFAMRSPAALSVLRWRLTG